MAEYHLTNVAVSDQIQIWDYTSKAWSKQQEEKYYNLLIEAFKSITKNPGN